MRLMVFGAAGNVGSRVVAEALTRGHDVTAVVRNPAHLRRLPAAANGRLGDAGNLDDVSRLAAPHEAVITATRPAPGRECEQARIARTLLAGLAGTGIRLLLVGGAGTLIVPGTDGRTLMEQPDYPASLRSIAQAGADQLDACRSCTDVDWAYLSPPARLVPGVRTGRFRLGGDELMKDAAGLSEISMEDFAVALLDEAERPRHHRARFTAVRGE